MSSSETYQHLSKAPIIEALVDIRFSTKEELSLEVFDRIHSHIKDQYSIKRETKQVTITFGDGASEDHPPSENILGFRYDSPVDGYVLQLNRTGFTLSKLAPYVDWEPLSAEAKRLWQLVSDHIGDNTVIRAALRYINRIELFGDRIDFDDYLTAGPKVPPELPQTLVEFITRNAIVFRDEKILALVTQSLDPSASSGNKVVVILDIDVFKNEISITDHRVLWNLFSQIREIKNRAFFSSLTPKMLEQLK